jgi:hypothetical protein
MLRSTFLATCVVALSASAAFGQSDSTLAGSDLAARTLPTIMVPAAPAVAEKSLTTIAPAVEPVFEARSVNADVATVVRRRESFGRPAVLMITGGALLVAGLLVDGDASSILIISGAGIGAYGLYLHLQTPNARFHP